MFNEPFQEPVLFILAGLLRRDCDQHQPYVKEELRKHILTSSPEGREVFVFPTLEPPGLLVQRLHGLCLPLRPLVSSGLPVLAVGRKLLLPSRRAAAS